MPKLWNIALGSWVRAPAGGNLVIRWQKPTIPHCQSTALPNTALLKLNLLVPSSIPYKGWKVEADVAVCPLLSLFCREENRDGDTCNSDALNSYWSTLYPCYSACPNENLPEADKMVKDQNESQPNPGQWADGTPCIHTATNHLIQMHGGPTDLWRSLPSCSRGGNFEAEFVSLYKVRTAAAVVVVCKRAVIHTEGTN